jgi:hypothetical protein
VRFTLCAIGSRGDVAPLLALGRALVERGSNVVVATPPEFAVDAAEAGLDFRPIAPMVMPLMEQASSAMGSPARMNLIASRWLDMDLYDDLDGLFAIAQGSQALIAETERFYDRRLGPVINPWRRDRGLSPATGFYRRMVGLPGERFLAADRELAPLPADVGGRRG